MNYLKDKRVYLSSPIQHSENEEWRLDVKTNLENFGLKVYDPALDIKQSSRELVIKYKKEENYEKLYEIVHQFQRLDLSLVDRADIIIAYVPYKVPTVGVCHEIINSNNAKKLTILVSGEAKNKIADWYFGFNKLFMFGRWDELYEFLKDVNQGKYKHHDRLYFLYNYPDVWN